MNIFLYTDYRSWIQDSIDELQKVKAFTSIRYICQKASLDTGNFVRVLQGKLFLTQKSIRALSEFFKLGQKEAQYFQELVTYAKAKTDKEAWASFNRLQSYKGVEVRALADFQFEYFSKWYHPVIRSLISITPFTGNYQKLSKMLVPAITVKEAKESIELLQKLELIKKEKGIYEVTGKFVKSNEKFSKQGIREYQKQNLQLAIQSLDIHSPDLRDISTVSLTLSKENLPTFKTRIKEFREEMLAMAKEINTNDTVYQINISMFPVAECISRGEND